MDIHNVEALGRILALAPLIPGEPVPLEEFASCYMLEEREVVECMEFLASSDLAEVAAAYDYDAEGLKGGRLRRLAPAAPLRPLPVTKDEGVVLMMVGRALADAGVLEKGTNLYKLLDERMSLFGHADERYVRDLAGRIVVHLGIDPSSLADTIGKAIASKKVIHMTYYSYSRDSFDERDVEPLRLVVSRGVWYLLAWCRMAGGYRFFRLDRIKTLEVTRKRFTRDPSDAPPLPEFIGEKGGRYRVRLSFPDKVRWSLAEDWNDAHFQRGPRPGWFTVEIRTGNLDWLAKYLLKFGSEFEVETPAALKAKVRDLAGEMLKSYR
ncbi:MAG: WYL domain-containing protein [Actinomycetota bacterium]